MNRFFKNFKLKIDEFKSMDSKDKKRFLKEFFINNSLFIFILIAVIYIASVNKQFLSARSIVNIISLSAASMPIALGIAGCIVLTGTDLSAGRIVGLTACISAALLQSTDISNKMFANLPTMPLIVVILAVCLIGLVVGAFNGFCVAKFSLHPFIVTLATQLMVYGTLLVFLTTGSNNGQSISGLDESYTNFIKGSIVSIPTQKGNVPIPNYVWFAIIITIIMWFIWNKTAFGKNMFAVGSNQEASHVSGVNVTKTIIMVFALAGLTYGLTGFIEGARIGSNSAATGLNYEADAIAACVIGGVSFVGGIGKIRGVVTGVVLLRLIFVGLNFLSINANLQFIIKGMIILVACAIDMRKYLVRK